jgi:cytochrome c-type biogenesis protein CcsB
MDPATLSGAAFTLGVIVLLVAFAANVGHAVLLANERRSLRVAATARQPAYAGVATGSFVTATTSAGRGPGPLAAAASPLSGAAISTTVIAFGLLVASLVLRATVVGRGPWGNLYEYSVAFAASILLGYLVLQRSYPIRAIGFIPVGVAAGLALYASSLPSDVLPLVPALQNAPLLTIHVGMAVLAYGIFATAFAAGVGYLAQGTGDRFAWLPSHRVLDQVAHRAVIIGFPIFATMIILGSWWASIAWSRYWGWDPKETAALVTWLIYAVYLHARHRRRWAGRPAALLLVIGFGMVLVTYSGSLWFSGLHSYSGL